MARGRDTHMAPCPICGQGKRRTSKCCVRCWAARRVCEVCHRAGPDTRVICRECRTKSVSYTDRFAAVRPPGGSFSDAHLAELAERAAEGLPLFPPPQPDGLG